MTLHIGKAFVVLVVGILNTAGIFGSAKYSWDISDGEIWGCGVWICLLITQVMFNVVLFGGF